MGVPRVTAFRVSGFSQSARAKSVRTRPGRDAIDPHARRAELGGEVAGELEVGRLRDVVGSDHLGSGEPADRADDDDRAFLTLQHLRRDHLDQPVIGDHIVLEDLAELSSLIPPIGP
jgi:hypothetical protein